MLTTISILFNAFMDICRLRRRPQDIPESSTLFFVCLAAYLVVSVLLVLLSMPLEQAVMITLLEVSLLMLFIYILLRLTHKARRWPQTMTAVFGTGIIISLFSIPLYYLGGRGDPQALMQNWSVLLLLGLIIWNIVVMAHILKHALQIRMIAGVMIMLGYIWLFSSLIVLLLPKPDVLIG